MYLPSAFREDSLDIQHEFIRAHPLGVVCTSGDGGAQAAGVLATGRRSGRGVTQPQHLHRAF